MKQYNSNWWLDALVKYFGPIAIWLLAPLLILPYFFVLPFFVRPIIGIVIIILVIIPRFIHIRTDNKQQSEDWIDFNANFNRIKKSIFLLIIHVFIAGSFILSFLLIKMISYATNSSDRNLILFIGIYVFLTLSIGSFMTYFRVRGIVKSPNVFSRFVSQHFKITQKKIDDVLKQSNIDFKFVYYEKSSFLVPEYATFSIKDSKVKINVVPKQNGADVSVVHVSEKEIFLAKKLMSIIDSVFTNKE